MNRDRIIRDLLGCAGVLCLLTAVFGGIIVMGMGAWASIRASNAPIEVEQQRTEQVRIEWGAQVAIAQAQERASVAASNNDYRKHRITWGVVGVVVVAVARMVMTIRRYEYE